MVNSFNFIIQIKNAIKVRKQCVVIPKTRLSLFFVNSLLEEGYIFSFCLIPKKKICIYLKYDVNGVSCIRNFIILNNKMVFDKKHNKYFRKDIFLNLDLFKGRSKKVIRIF